MRNILKRLNWRYSTKVFDKNKKVSKEDLETILESFRLSASSFGLQPWKLIVVEDKKIRESLVEHSWGQRQVVDSGKLLVFCRPNIIGDGLVDSYIDSIIKNRGGDKESLKGYEEMMKGFLSRLSLEDKYIWAEKQIYIALGNVMAVCASIGIDSCPMEGFSKEKYNEILGLTDLGLSSVVLLPIGYRDKTDKYNELKKVRFDKTDIIKFL